MKISSTIKIIRLMNNDNWYSNITLNKVAGWRFWWHLFQLRKYWCKFEKKQWKWYIEYWKLIYIPKDIDYSGNSIKTIKKKTIIEKVKTLFKL